MVVQNHSPYVQQSTLRKLLCSRCKKYLSVPPIYTHVTQGTICGRCPIGDTENFVRNELYENAIEFQKFPCIYQERGCLESLLPSQVLEHEERCFYLEHNCPTRIYNNCTWQGTTDSLLNHFETMHPAFLLKECQFEVDFVNNHNENYVMPFAEDMYIVTREANSTEKTFAITVSYLGPSNDIDEYKYNVTLESGNRAYKYSISQAIGQRLELQGQIVRQMLHDPISIIANISIEEPPVNKINASGDSTNGVDDMSNPDIDYNQLTELECPVCMEYMVPPIFQCERGHSICGSCKELQKECPTCRGAINQTQNYVLERVINNMIYPCKHSGCNYSTKAKNIRQHEASCLFGPFKCPLQDYENCSDVFQVSELFNHIKIKHYESLIELDTISIPMSDNIDEDITEGYILKHGQLLFKLCFKYVHSEDVFNWAVQLVGPPEESLKFKFELEIIDNNGKNNRLYIKMNCSPLAHCDKSFENDEHYVYLDKDQVSKFIKNQLTYRIRIVK